MSDPPPATCFGEPILAAGQGGDAEERSLGFAKRYHEKGNLPLDRKHRVVKIVVV
jgi:hypothetical protein